ncbi:MAG: nuclear transport factor 2 family protein [Myxococcota bacterium]
MTDPKQQIRALYAAFNRRDSSYVTDRMSPDVTWPRAFKGGVVRGPEAVRAYWEAQWAEIDPHVEPLRIERDEDGRYDVEVHQVVKDLAGTVIADSTVHHVYTFDGPVIVGMQIALDR